MSAGTSAEATQVDPTTRAWSVGPGTARWVAPSSSSGPMVAMAWLLGSSGSLGEARRTADVLDHARRLGLPVPRQELVVAVDDDVVMVQERLSGLAPQRVSREFVDSLVDLDDTFADVLADRRDVTSGNPYPRHEVLETHSARSRQVLEAIRKIGVDWPNQMTGTGLLLAIYRA